MRYLKLVGCLAVVLTAAVYVVADAQTTSVANADTSVNADAKLQFAIEYDQAQDRLYAVSRASANKASKTAMLVTCDTIRFEPNSIVFTNAELESPGQKIKADAATVRLDRVTGSNVSWHFSENATISMSGKDAAESFLKESSRD